MSAIVTSTSTPGSMLHKQTIQGEISAQGQLHENIGLTEATAGSKQQKPSKSSNSTYILNLQKYGVSKRAPD